MTARVFDLYDLNAPFVAPTAPAATPRAQTTPATTATAPTAAQGRSLMDKLSDSLLFNASVVLGVFAGVTYLLGTFLAPTPLGQVTGVQNMALWLTVILGGLAAAGAMTAVLVATIVKVTR